MLKHISWYGRIMLIGSVLILIAAICARLPEIRTALEKHSASAEYQTRYGEFIGQLRGPDPKLDAFMYRFTDPKDSVEYLVGTGLSGMCIYKIGKEGPYGKPKDQKR